MPALKAETMPDQKATLTLNAHLLPAEQVAELLLEKTSYLTGEQADDLAQLLTAGTTDQPYVLAYISYPKAGDGS